MIEPQRQRPSRRLPDRRLIHPLALFAVATLRSLIDTALDRTIVGGYTSLGYRARSGAWSHDPLPRLDGQVVAVTGATSGLGLAAAEGFARLGAAVRLLVRSPERGETARAAVLAAAPKATVTIDVCDLASLASVRECAEALAQSREGLHVLVNNAGVLPERRTLSPDGIELTFATNVVGPFLLTNLLVPTLARSAPARVINVSSGGMYAQRIHIDDLQMEHTDFDGVAAYARAKRAEVILTEMWAQRLAPLGIVVHAMHPGWVDTPGIEHSLPQFHRLTRRILRTPAEGADTIVWLGAAPAEELGSGRFWHDRRARPTHLLPWTREQPADRERLWQTCAELSGWGKNGGPTASTPSTADPDRERGL